MAALRSSLPSRLRRLLSNETAIGPSVKLDSEPSPKIKAFIDKVIQSPLQDIAIPLSGFKWEYNKGDFHHWGPLFLHFDAYFKTYLSSRSDLLLSDNILEDDSPIPKNAILQILRVMQIILENCNNKSSFSGIEHFKLLLTSTDPEILIATLETLSAFVKINPSKLHGSAKLIGCGSINSCLLSLAQGWGSKEEGLGLYSCVTANEKNQEEGLCLFPSDTERDHDKGQFRQASTLYFELHGVNNSQKNEETSSSSASSSSSSVIHIRDLHLQKEDDLLLMKQCIDQYNVPSELRFSLLTRVRYAHAFRSPRICRLYSRICLLAFIVLVQSNDAQDELMSLFANEPEYMNELIRIVRSEEIVSGNIRTLAMLALGAQLAAYTSSHERARVLTGYSINFTGGNRMIFLNVLQKAVSSLNVSNDPSSLAFVEAILQFYMLHVISSSNSGGVIRGSGMVPTFLPLLEDSNPSHMHIVYFAVKTLQKLMDYSHTAVSLFKDLGGVELLSQRLQVEVHRVIGLSGGDNNSMIIGESSSSSHSDQLLYSQKRLIKVILKGLGSATYAPANATRSQNSGDNSLPATLSMIFGHADKFGGDIYASAVTLMSEIIHKDPTCFSILHDLGLPQAFLSSVISGVLPSSKALTSIPHGLGAICLNAKGLEAVNEVSALRFLVDIFTAKKYVVAMNEGIVPLSSAMEELLRHVSSLRGIGVDLIIEIVNKISSIGDNNSAGSLEKGNESSTAMEMDSEEKENVSPCLVVGGTTDLVGGSEGISDEHFIQLCIFHVMVLVHRAIENSETCRLFVEKSGIEALLKLLLRPSISQSSEGMSIALHSTLVFKGFTQNHSAPLARAFCSSLRDHLNKCLTGLGAFSGSCLLDPKTTPDKNVFSSLFIVEFLLFLAASKDSRWVSALLTEFGNGSKDVLEDVGRVHREVLWQLALLEHAKHDEVAVDDDLSYVPDAQQSSESNENENEELRFNSFRQFLDPLRRRRISGRNVETQFFELLNLYRDLNRATGHHHQQRLGTESTPSNLLSGSSEADGSVGKKEHDKQRSYSSCCDMLRSISLHVTHLFQELGKAMLIPSRRRDDTVNVSPASKSVVSSFASISLDHMNFEGHSHASTSTSEASVSTKCRYLGKVIDFIDGILLEKSDSCNPVVLNCLFGRGVVHLVLTTFEATSQLLFAINRTPSSPMETDDGSLKQDEKEESDRSWIYGPLASYGKLMDHLVTSSFILSPFTKHLLVQPVPNGEIPFPSDAEAFVKVLQSVVLKAVIPVWTHPNFINCSYNFITTVISIIRHVYSGVEVKNVNSSSNNTSARVMGPPPNEASISTIVEMGFSRLRAEEALRQVGTNSVESAMDWLFSHPEEIQEEDDELARALAISLGKGVSDTKDGGSSTENSLSHVEDEMAQLPPVEELLSTCTKLLQKESVAFPVKDLLVMLCSQNDGQYRSTIVTYIIDQVKECSLIPSIGQTDISAIFHLLALILHEDALSREIALKTGLIEIALKLLSQWDSGTFENEKIQVPKWVITVFLAIDRLLHVDKKLDSEIIELLKKVDSSSSQQNNLIINEKEKNSPSSLEQPHPICIDIMQQKKLIEIACSCLRKQLGSETTHAILQLCATLTKDHSVGLSFLEAGGLPLLLSLPTSSMFSGFDSIAATIIRHILEDPQSLQQAMESEIRHILLNAVNRQTPRVTPRTFLSSLSSVITRDPVIFMQAAQAVCQVEMLGERPYVVLLKDREKDKSKEKEVKEKDKTQVGNNGKVVLGNSSSAGGGQSKIAKVHRKPPQSFVNVVELLLDFVVTFLPSSISDSTLKNVLNDDNIASLTDMDVDIATSKGKGKAIENEAVINSEASASLAKTVFILKLLTEILTKYTPAVHIVLRRDTEISSCRGPIQRVHNGSGGCFHHILHQFLPCSKSYKKERRVDGAWSQKLATKATQFMVAACVRSTEARKRVFTEVSYIFNEFVDSSNGFRPPHGDLQVFIDLLNEVLVARTPTGSSISSEASATFVDVGLIKSLTRTLQVLDLDHADSTKVVTSLIKALELVTKEHVHSVDSSIIKNDNSVKAEDRDLQGGRTNNSGDVIHSMETASHQPNQDSMAADRVESISTVQAYGGSQAVTDDMEHDQDLDATEDDYMHESSEEARGILENEINAVGIHFEIQPHVQENLVDEDDDEEMSGDDGDEVDEDEDDDDDDEEEHNDLEEDEVHHHLPHPDTDQDDHEIDDDEFDEEMLEEEDEDEDDDDEEEEEGVILRLDEGINGIDVLDHIDVFGRRNNFPGETLHVMPVEVFGSRRRGRTTSIYNLLGRTGDNHTAPPRHPLLVGPFASLHHSSPVRQSENGGDVVSSDQNLESMSLDTVFRSLRNGRHGNRINLWADESQPSGGSNVVVPQGLEEVFVSRLRRSDPVKPSNNQNTTVDPQSQLEGSEAGASAEAPIAENNDTTTELRTTTASELPHEINASTSTHIEQNDTTVRDVEAVSQESSGSGATLGESLRSLDVEIGSADGHDDGGERQGSARRTSGRDVPLHSVTEVAENPSQEADHDDSAEEEQQINGGDADSRSIDPAFLDALPEVLRAEVLSAQQGQVAQPSNAAEPETTADIDPEFLAALPPDIRAEVLAQQASQRLHQSHELEGQPVEMDTVSIIATFPSDIREEVLLTSSEAILANLTPALVAEANMLRERFAHRYHHTLFGMYPGRNRRGGESSRRGEGIGSSLIGAGGSITARRSMGSKLVEADGDPLVDAEALRAMIRLFRIVQPLYKGQLQRLLLNLCAHSETRIDLVKIMMDMLTLEMKKPMDQMETSEPLHRLYACQSHVVYSRPQFFDGIPPLVSRRILETLTYLARNHPFVAKILLQFRLPQPTLHRLGSSDRGKAVMVVDENDKEEGEQSIALLLSLLSQPLYLRSIAHLEQLLNLLEVIIDNAENKSSSSNKLVEASASVQSSGPQISVPDAEMMNTESTDVPSAGTDGNTLSTVVESSSSKPTSRADSNCNDTISVLANLPQVELRLLCSLLAREGLSDNAYTLVAEVVKKLVAIAPSHCHLFITELAEAVRNLKKSAIDELHLFGEAEKALLSTTSSDGATVLRVLQALSSLVASLSEKEKDTSNPSLPETEHAAALTQVLNINAELEPLWLELSTCISKVESYSESAAESSSTGSNLSKPKPSGVMAPLPAGTQNILPYIESFFVMCENLAGHDSIVAPASDVPKIDEKNIAFVKFSDRHRKLLNAFIRQNPGLLEKSFSLMLKVPRFIDFDNKRVHFRSKIKSQHDHHHGSLRISVRRAYILEDSYNQLRMRSTQDLKGRLTVQFQGEEGIDAGGLTREWYQLLSKFIFDKGALLFTTVGNESTFQPNPNSVYQTEHLSYFKFVGRVVGKALFDGQLLDVHFTRSFYKHILGVKVTYHDIEAIDPDYFKNLKWMLENDISDILDLTFSIDADEEKLILYEKTEVTDYELIPGGRNIKVTEENKHKYVDLIAEHRLTTAIRPQINAFLEGFTELVSRDLISIFNDKELELLISGLPDIDLEDMRANTEYSGYSAASPVIQWFWEVVQCFSKEDKARLLQFVTGTSKVPLEGFSALQGISGSQKFQIHKAYGSAEHLPSAHTCFNQLDLPEYPSKQQLEDRLLLAIHEANEGFGFG